MSGTRLRLEGGLVRQSPADNTGSGKTVLGENGNEIFDAETSNYVMVPFFLRFKVNRVRRSGCSYRRIERTQPAN